MLRGALQRQRVRGALLPQVIASTLAIVISFMPFHPRDWCELAAFARACACVFPAPAHTGLATGPVKGVPGTAGRSFARCVCVLVYALVCLCIPCAARFVDTDDRDNDAPLQWLFNGLNNLGQVCVSVCACERVSVCVCVCPCPCLCLPNQVICFQGRICWPNACFETS
jgi:hypothetical protein